MKPKTTKAKALKHLFDNTSTNPATGCWEWEGSLTKDGYGQLGRDSIAETFGAKGVHRLGKIIIDGWEPEGRHEQTRHQCHNRRCWNPDHILIGTAADNAADKVAAGRSYRAAGENHPRCKITDKQVVEIRAERARGVDLATLAARFGLTPTYISALANGRSRGDIQ